MLQEEPGILGPSREYTAQLMVEEDIGTGVVDLDSSTTFCLIDLDDAVAYLLSLMEEPPLQLFAERMPNISATGRPFSLLCRQLGQQGRLPV